MLEISFIQARPLLQTKQHKSQFWPSSSNSQSYFFYSLHKIVAPCTLYGAKIYGFKNYSQLETLQHKYLKYALKLKNSTPTSMIQGETGYLLLEYHMKIKMRGFWASLISGNRDKLLYKMYFLCLTLYNDGLLKFEWLHYIKSISDECGLTYVFENQLGYEHKWLENFSLPKIKF